MTIQTDARSEISARVSPSYLRHDSRLALALRIMASVIIIALAVVGAVIVGDSPGFHPSTAVPFMVISALLTAGIVLWLRRGVDLGPRSVLALPIPLYDIYLATIVFASPWSAVLIAAVISFHDLIPYPSRRPVGIARVATAFRQSAIAAVTTLAAGATFVIVTSAIEGPAISIPHQFSVEEVRARLVGATLMTIIMLAGSAISRVMDLGRDALLSRAAWNAYFRSPSFRFQLLLLVMGPLLPFLEALDDTAAISDLAWVLFLVPLYCIYYLALMSFRLDQKNGELAQMLKALTVARRREDELTGYAARITRAQEEERLRLSRELHDETAQTLIALTRGLDAFATRPVTPPLPPADHRFLTDLSGLAKRSLESIRRACQALRPAILDDLGLGPALASLVDTMTARGMRCTYVESGERSKCTPEVEVTAYRIAQEALSNAFRHAHASRVVVDLTYAADTLRLIVRDNGRGFAMQPALNGVHPVPTEEEDEARPHLGLLGMRERALLIGATLEVESTADQGTTVTLRVPLFPL